MLLVLIAMKTVLRTMMVFGSDLLGLCAGVVQHELVSSRKVRRFPLFCRLLVRHTAYIGEMQPIYEL